MEKKNRLGLIFSSYWGAWLVYVEIKEAKGQSIGPEPGERGGKGDMICTVMEPAIPAAGIQYFYSNNHHHSNRAYMADCAITLIYPSRLLVEYSCTSAVTHKPCIIPSHLIPPLPTSGALFVPERLFLDDASLGRCVHWTVSQQGVGINGAVRRGAQQC